MWAVNETVPLQLLNHRLYVDENSWSFASVSIFWRHRLPQVVIRRLHRI
jgi:hypothetical protein